ETLPEIDDVAQIAERAALRFPARALDPRQHTIQVRLVLLEPALRVTRAHSLRVDLGDHPDRARDHGGLRLGAAHAAEPRAHEDTAREALALRHAQIPASPGPAPS